MAVRLIEPDESVCYLRISVISQDLVLSCKERPGNDCSYAPGFLAWSIGSWFVRHKDNPKIRVFVMGATAAAAGAIVGAVYVLSCQTVTDWATAGIAVAALAVVLRFKNKEPFIVALGEVAGLLLH